MAINGIFLYRYCVTDGPFVPVGTSARWMALPLFARIMTRTHVSLPGTHVSLPGTHVSLPRTHVSLRMYHFLAPNTWHVTQKYLFHCLIKVNLDFGVFFYLFPFSKFFRQFSFLGIVAKVNFSLIL